MTLPALTIFSAPKPFTDSHIDTIQRNAIQSWLGLGESVQVLLLGDEEGMAETCTAFGVQHIDRVQTNAWSTPLISAIFDQARQHSQAPLLCYVNADILLTSDILQAAESVRNQAKRFLMIGQRYDLDIREPLEFTAGWEDRLRSEVQRRGRLHPPAGSDFFVFPRESFLDIPDFAVGRAGWDNWMIYHARNKRWPTVDVTPDVMVVHQNHDYSHLPDGQAHYDLEESDENLALAGGRGHMFILLDSDRQLVNGQLRPAPMTLPVLLRRAEVRLTPEDGSRRGWRGAIIRCLRKLRRRLTP